MRYFTKDKIWIFFLMVSQQKNYIRRNENYVTALFHKGRNVSLFLMVSQQLVEYLHSLICGVSVRCFVRFIIMSIVCTRCIIPIIDYKKKPPKKTFLSIFERYSLIIAKVCEYWLTIVCIRTLLPTLFDEI